MHGSSTIHDYPSVVRLVEQHGLAARGGFSPRPEDEVPTLEPGRPTRALVMVGIVPGRGWRAFRESRHWGRAPAPLDAFSRDRVSAIAAKLDARPLFPFDGPPWLPFQRWAGRAEACYPSPLGLLLHPRHGLWHGYRGALALGRPLGGLPRTRAADSPCASCQGRPCLQACPVAAFSAGSLDARRCRDHLDGAQGQKCLDAGCLARAACPVASAGYPLQQRRFHMLAFKKGRVG